MRAALLPAALALLLAACGADGPPERPSGPTSQTGAFALDPDL